MVVAGLLRRMHLVVLRLWPLIKAVEIALRVDFDEMIADKGNPKALPRYYFLVILPNSKRCRKQRLLCHVIAECEICE